MNIHPAIRAIGHDGLSDAERAILDAWDAGHPPRRIAALTGRPLAQVGRILRQFGPDRQNWMRDAVAASAALVAAIRRHHPDRPSAGASQ